jgi:hypothetical protein
MAIALHFNPTARYYSLGLTAIQITYDAHVGGVFQDLTNSPAHSSSKFYSFYYFFIHKAKLPWLEATINPLLRTAISVIASSVCCSLKMLAKFLFT